MQIASVVINGGVQPDTLQRLESENRYHKQLCRYSNVASASSFSSQQQQHYSSIHVRVAYIPGLQSLETVIHTKKPFLAPCLVLPATAHLSGSGAPGLSMVFRLPPSSKSLPCAVVLIGDTVVPPRQRGQCTTSGRAAQYGYSPVYRLD
jgi:hypothetical protein